MAGCLAIGMMAYPRLAGARILRKDEFSRRHLQEHPLASCLGTSRTTQIRM